MNAKLNQKYSISTDKSKLDIIMIHDFLKTSYWAENIPLSIVQKSIDNSFCFCVYEDTKQIGFARVISDCATLAYLGDLFILEPYRGQGLAKCLVETILSDPELQGLRSWFLATKDAYGLYRKYGFQELKNPEAFMTIRNQNIYQQ